MAYTNHKLGEFHDTPEDDQTAPDQARPAWNPDGQTRCRCGAAVGSETARVMGDNRDTVPVCATCYKPRDGRGSYASDARALVSYYSGEGV